MAIFTAAAALALKLLLVPRFGVAGAVWATAAAYLLLTALPTALLLPGIVARLRSSTTASHAPTP